ncbi:MAG: dihydropteroate synthase [Acidobacteria bacterium]|nr:dihydropteroate synthase [Acidobacteriota bacterium]
MTKRRKFRLQLPARTLVLGERTLVMGVLNVTPDSFSDGGKFRSVRAAVARALEMERQGADILDIGGESTRPGSAGVSTKVELACVLPVIQRLRRKLRIPISIDTRKSHVAEAAIAAGAEIINDVSALRSDPRMAEIVARHRVAVVLMHMRGDPRTMQRKPFARDVLRDVKSGLRAAVDRAQKAGIARSRIVLDPGIGFGKSFAQNFELLARLPELSALGFSLLIGTSRKAFLSSANYRGERPRTSKMEPFSERIWGTAATVATSILGGAHIVRVHDVAEMVRVARVTDAILRAE